MGLRAFHAKKIEHGNLRRNDLDKVKLIDVNQTKRLFKDFGINEEIPEFATRGELWSWRNRLIRGVCNE